VSGQCGMSGASGPAKPKWTAQGKAIFMCLRAGGRKRSAYGPTSSQAAVAKGLFHGKIDLMAIKMGSRCPSACACKVGVVTAALLLAPKARQILSQTHQTGPCT